MAVTSEYLLRGAMYALEHCGMLLRSANHLYETGDNATAKVLANFAREELGRNSILLKLRKKVISGSGVTLDQVKKECGDHVTRQRAGMLSVTFTAQPGTSLGEAIGGSDRGKLETLVKAKRKRTPADRHEARMLALYVDPISETEWNRPADVTPDDAHAFLSDAVNDYAGRYHRFGPEPQRPEDGELLETLEGWTDRPTLPPPLWPDLPDAE